MTATPQGMTYADYLKLDQLLDAQAPLSDLHDEMLFIVIHQTKELWLKQMLHEVALANRLLRGDHFAAVHKALSRVSRIQSVTTLSWDVLSTLTPFDYMKFRHVLGTSSGFQSAQFRELEFRLGLKDPKYLEMHEGGSEGPQGLEPPLPNRACGMRPTRRLAAPVSMSPTTTRSRAGWLAVYRDADSLFDLYGLAEKLVDLDDALAALAAQACADGGADHRHETRNRRIGRSSLSSLDPRQARLPCPVGPAHRNELQAPILPHPGRLRQGGCISPPTAITSGLMPASTARSNAGRTPPGSPT